MQLRTTHGLVEIDEFEDMPERVFEKVLSQCVLLRFMGLSKAKHSLPLRTSRH